MARLIMVALISGLASGALLSTLVLSSSPVPPSAGTDLRVPGPVDLASSLQAVVSDLRAASRDIRLQSTSRPLQGSSHHTADECLELEAALARLHEIVEVLDSTPPAHVLGIETAHVQERRHWLREFVATEELRPVPRKAWRFWTPVQLMQEYGEPDGVSRHHDGSLRWTYEWDDAGEVAFVVSNGVAIDLEIAARSR